MIHHVIIVGAGSSGAVLAGRLSEDAGSSILLVEPAGPATRRRALGYRDTYYYSVFQPKYFWPDLLVHLRPLASSSAAPRRYEQARIMGGGSSINAMIAMRGLPADFWEWGDHGAAGWSWEDVLPFYRAARTRPGFRRWRARP